MNQSIKIGQVMITKENFLTFLATRKGADNLIQARIVFQDDIHEKRLGSKTEMILDF